MKKRVFAMLLVLICAVVCATVIPAVTFTDVSSGHWAYTEISDMARRRIIQGSNGKFRPADTISRQAFLSMICRATGLDDRSLESGDSWWKPLQAYARYFDWCSEAELNEANRALPITRELAAKFLIKGFFPNEKAVHGAAAFTDHAAITPAYRSYVQTAASLGLITGYEDGTFRPGDTLTRAAAAAIISHALELEESRQPIAGKSIQIPVLMYHDISYLGHGYSKTPEIFLRQMEELKSVGFNTVFFSEIVDFVENGTPLPARPIVITFDDGYMSNYTYAFPILKNLGMKAEISLIGDAVQYTDWGLRWAEIEEMQASGLIRFQAHTQALHDAAGRTGVLKKADENWLDYVQMFADDAQSVQSLLLKKTGNVPQVFTYPLGKHNAMTEAVVKQLGYRVSLTTQDGVAEVTQGDPESLYLMDRIGMDFRNGSVVSTLWRFGYRG